MTTTLLDQATIDVIRPVQIARITINGVELVADYSKFAEGALQISIGDKVVHESYNYGIFLSDFPEELKEFDNVQWWLTVVFKNYDKQPRRCLHPGDILKMHKQSASPNVICRMSGLTTDRLNKIMHQLDNLTEDDCQKLGKYMFGAKYWRRVQDTFDKSEKSCHP